MVGASCSVHCFEHDVPQSVGGMYGTNAFLLPVDDPDAAVTADTIWDREVPKDVEESAGAFDLDSATADTDPEFAIGAFDLSSMFGYGPREIKGGRRRKLITFANSRAAYQGAAVDTYSMVDTFTLTLGETERVETPSLVAIGFSSPTIDETTTVWTAPLEDQWINLQFPKWTVMQALVELLGQIETGAESPWEDASAFIFDHLEPSSQQATAGSILFASWNVFAQTTFLMDVPGTPSVDLDTDA